MPRRNRWCEARAKASFSTCSARKALITLMPDRISTSRWVTSANTSCLRRALRRMRAPKSEITPPISGPTTSMTRESFHETKSSAPTPTAIMSRDCRKSPKSRDRAWCAPPTSPMIRASTSPRWRSWWKRSGSANSLPHTSTFMSISMRPSTYCTRYSRENVTRGMAKTMASAAHTTKTKLSRIELLSRCSFASSSAGGDGAWVCAPIPDRPRSGSHPLAAPPSDWLGTTMLSSTGLIR
jgi:hypothetical protein